MMSKNALWRQPASAVPVILLVALAVSLLGWAERGALLQSVARKWAVTDTLAPADAVAVLGGSGERPYMAAELYKSGLARRIVFDIRGDGATLLNLGIPRQAIQRFAVGATDTVEVACALARWARENGVHSIIVPTERFPSRRVKWIFDRQFENTQTRIMIDTAPNPDYADKRLWISSATWRQFITEIMKYAFSRAAVIFNRCAGPG